MRRTKMRRLSRTPTLAWLATVLVAAALGADGFFDSVDPVTGTVGHRYLVLDQSMIMAALDNALNNRALQRDFARDPVA
jgi:hypothetical protein